MWILYPSEWKDRLEIRLRLHGFGNHCQCYRPLISLEPHIESKYMQFCVGVSVGGQIPINSPYFSIFFDRKTIWNEHTSTVFIPMWYFFALFWNIFCSVSQKKLCCWWCQHDTIRATFKIVICAKDKVCWRSQKIVS